MVIYRNFLYLGLMALSLIFGGCSSKKKTVERYNDADQSETIKSIDSLAASIKREKNKTYSGATLEIKAEINNLTLTPIDSARPLTFKDNKGNTYEATNAAVNINTSTIKQKQKDTLKTVNLALDSTFIKVNDYKQQKNDTSKRGRKTDADITRMPTGVTIFLVVAVIAVLLYFLNPLKL